MRKEILALVASAVALVALAARGQEGAIDPNRPHGEHEHDCPPSLRYGAAGEQAREKDKKQKYTCPMHPEVVTDHPGNCPKCGTELVSNAEKKRPMPNAQGTTPNHPSHETHPPSQSYGEAGIDGVILAGTELPLILRDPEHNGIPFLDTTKIHCEAAVAEMLL